MRRRALKLGGQLDRYVGQLFAGAYAVALVLIVGLFLILDLASNLDDYLQSEPGGPSSPGLLVLRFYALNLPFLYLQVAPFVTLVAGLFTLSKLVRSNEVVAALNAGVSTHRMLLPLFVGAVLLMGAMFGLREWATESIGRRRDILQDRLEEQRDELIVEELWLKDANGIPVHIASFRPGHPGRPGAEIEGLEATLRRGGDLINIEAEHMTWVRTPEGTRWQVVGGLREIVRGTERERATLDGLEGFLEFDPRDVLVAWKGRERPLDLSFGEARELAVRDPDNTQYQTLLHYHLSFPLAHLVLLCVGLPFLVRLERGKGLEGIAVGFVLCVFYFAADFVSRSLGIQGELGPLVASWLPVLFFGSVGVVVFGSMRT